jgi:hypothetical protein
VGAHSQTENNSAGEMRVRNNQISFTLAAIFDTVKTTQKSMPKALGYPWEGDISSTHVHIDDVLGRSIILPIALCRTRQTLKDTMRIMFSDHPGLKEVANGNFELVNTQNQVTVFDGRADRSRYVSCGSYVNGVSPGAKLSMNIMRIQTLHAPKEILVNSVQTLETCPRCGFDTPGRGFRKWYYFTHAIW